MNKLFFIALCITLFAGCDKVKRTKRKLTGKWEVISYQFTNVNGLSSQYEPTSSCVIYSDCDEDICDYSMKMIYEDQGMIKTFDLSGSYEFVEDNGEYYNLYYQNGSQLDTLYNARIILITKDDLFTEFGDENGRHVLVLKND